MEKKTHKLLEKEQNKTNIFWLNKLQKIELVFKKKKTL